MSSPDPLAPATTPNPLQPVQVSSTTAVPPTPVTDPAEPVAPADPLAGMTPEQVDDLATRITEARANRPPSLAEQFSQIQDALTQTSEQKAQVVDQRKAATDQRNAASEEADKLVDAISEIKDTMRRMELVEAASLAQFAAPAVVADALLKKNGDVASLVAEAAKSGAYTMKTPATSAQIGGGKQAPTDGMDPGMAALIQEVREATGR